MLTPGYKTFFPDEAGFSFLLSKASGSKYMKLCRIHTEFISICQYLMQWKYKADNDRHVSSKTTERYLYTSSVSCWLTGHCREVIEAVEGRFSAVSRGSEPTWEDAAKLD